MRIALSLALAVSLAAAPLAAQGHAAHSPAPADSSFAALQQRGAAAMGVDQYTSAHRFDSLADGGRIELQREVDDSAGVAQIRRHLREIARAFAAGDFATPEFVHAGTVPGTQVVAERRAAIHYTYRDLPRGGEVRLTTADPQALEAIHSFMAYQRAEHHVGGEAPADGHHGGIMMHVHSDSAHAAHHPPPSPPAADAAAPHGSHPRG